MAARVKWKIGSNYSLALTLSLTISTELSVRRFHKQSAKSCAADLFSPFLCCVLHLAAYLDAWIFCLRQCVNIHSHHTSILFGSVYKRRAFDVYTFIRLVSFGSGAYSSRSRRLMCARVECVYICACTRSRSLSIVAVRCSCLVCYFWVACIRYSVGS